MGVRRPELGSACDVCRDSHLPALMAAGLVLALRKDVSKRGSAAVAFGSQAMLCPALQRR